MQKPLRLWMAMLLCVSGIIACGGTTEPESPLEDASGTTSQQALACVNDGTMAGACSSSNTCVGGTCRPRCSSSGTCSSGQRCCPGYMYSDGSLMHPYCIATSQGCYNPGGVDAAATDL
ncbi:hypothetical protein LZ198_19740 [Myxococcus sp. K15C18031901]|uniref:hypothetical protein n=1 Tax=Myxococcus dinghuensis TaxID=2906761 RepID=UPI0020A74037|nr:hypothetical protein [Myxococcus dinghuensis]MCP3101111.1 hypothetical protein [Myxococcus dinghuensis]